MEREIVLCVRDLNVKFSLRGKVLHAIRGISMDLYKGESLAIVGESGSGKSVLCKNFIGLLDKNGWVDSGSIMYKGMDLAKFKTEKEWTKIRGKEVAMVMQDPMTSLNPLKTVGWQIGEALKLHQGLTGEAAKKKTVEILTDVGIIPSRTRACARSVAVVVPSPATSFVLAATSLTSCAPMFSNASLNSISFAIVTPSLVIKGPPYCLPRTTFLPLGPNVTLTVFAN